MARSQPSCNQFARLLFAMLPLHARIAGGASPLLFGSQIQKAQHAFTEVSLLRDESPQAAGVLGELLEDPVSRRDYVTQPRVGRDAGAPTLGR